MLIDRVAKQIKPGSTAVYMSQEFYGSVGYECDRMEGRVSYAACEFQGARKVAGLPVYAATAVSSGHPDHPDFVII